MKKPTVLLILDGYGERKEKDGNAIALANTPVMDKLKKEFPYVEGQASGLFVGLPDGQMGNSEVGHMNMGAGRIVYQELTRITKAIEDGDFFENKALKEAVEHCKKENTALHFMGLVSSGGVHSHIGHIYGLLELAKRAGLKKVYLHAFLDGRDTPPDSGKSFLMDVEKKMQELGVGEIATISGRYYAMDRDKNYDRVEKAYRAMVDGTGEKASSVEEAIDASYAKKVYDEFVLPTVIEKDGAVHTVADGDAMIFFNFRPDRAREICHAFCDDEFNFFNRGARKKVFFVCFTDYDPTIPNKRVAFEKEEIHNTLGEVVSNLGKNQLRIAETEKYAHVTFFFNGGKEEPYENEDRILAEAIRSGKYDLVVANFANPDMVGHTGVLSAAIKAIEVVDECMGKVVDAVESMHGNLFILADHGNADIMIDEKTGEPYTAHTTNPVPFILVSDEKHKLREGGCLADVAPTLLELMGIPQPKEMTGKSLLEK